MVNRRASDAGALAQVQSTPIAPVVKRKRRASCLGEQERRERKRAIDREAQRSLREKTKTHIAELERTIQILRDQDRNGATASLLSEIDGLRAENERLRDVIDSVKSVVGSEIFPRQNPNQNKNEGASASPEASVGHNSPKPRSVSVSLAPPPQHDSKMLLPTPDSLMADPLTSQYDSLDFDHMPATSGTVDLDGMTVMTDLAQSDSALNLSLAVSNNQTLPEVGSMLDVPDSPSTAAWAPYIAEIFGPGWRCPSPVILHIGNPDRPSTPTPSSTALCPMWKKSNELFGRVFNYRPGSHALNSETIEAGLLYLGIRSGWHTFDNWMQSPALRILKEVDEFLFHDLPKMDRLATAYKSFKLLKYYLNATKEELEKVPEWLRPSPAQARTKHPIALDFFAWPTLRDRLVQNHHNLFTNTDLSQCYSHYLRFDWPFSFDDAFFYDDIAHGYYPSPLFERYHRDLKYWTVSDSFYDRFPEMRTDIEGDRARFSEEIVA